MHIKRKDDTLHIRIDEELKKRAKTYASKRGRTLAEWVRDLIVKEMDRVTVRSDVLNEKE